MSAAGLAHGEVALLLAFGAFVILLIEITWVRRRRDLERDLRLPFSEAPRAREEERGASDVER
jgi:hypothetical protein